MNSKQVIHSQELHHFRDLINRQIRNTARRAL